MTLQNLTCTSILLAVLTGCASAPKAEPIDNALLADVSTDARSKIAEARAARDAAEDALANAKGRATKLDKLVELDRASLKTVRAQLDESEVAIEVAESIGTPADVERAVAEHALALARTDVMVERLQARKSELELAQLLEKLAIEENDLSIARVELVKAEALQDVDLAAAQKVRLADYRERVAHFVEAVESRRSNVRTATAQFDTARGRLADAQKKLDALGAGPRPAAD